ncbi:glycoside hydrolase family 2 protein [Bacillus sp. OK048]|uniref:glycoside hydrolase family 2 protein n=1 Tax=Bacillus sp. OK048 TaxID=1882761 RepID=UPI00088EF3B0|nr:glycoside hydrolase family 2 TIM barrel-domain containing protein [Bacillus sp. OK048]SDM84175.1 Glycosyl hydrolases family 2 [Bacillus sp. OK048]
MEKLKYPNPQKIRKNWIDLNGKWLFKLDKNGGANITGPIKKEEFDLEITVPYSYMFEKSGIDIQEYYPVVWYYREFQLNKQENKSYLLNFEAIDYKCDIWINDVLVCTHEGGHVPFEVDVTNFVGTNNTITIRVEDHNDTNQPIGKQSWKDENFLCWYTRTIGIWQNVWLEETGITYITNFTMKPNIHTAELAIDATINHHKNVFIEAKVTYKGQLITKMMSSFKNSRAKFSIDVSSNLPNFRLFYWHPTDPNLYDIELNILDENDRVEDSIESYFGMRGIESHEEKIYINDQEFYQKLILNQGYYPNAGLTGTTDEFLDDLKKIQEMGFNGLRIHQKLESHKLLYLCDVLGLVVWAEMPSLFEFSRKSNENMFKEIHPFVDKHINHPSVITYVVMNESWGVNEISHHEEEQHFVNALYYTVKSLDCTRLVIGNDGWEHTLTDVCTIHDYNTNEDTLIASYENKEMAIKESPSLTSGRKTYCKGYEHQQKPFIISEYGGVAYQEDISEASWGYGERIQSKDDVLQKIENLTKAVMKIEFCSGFCYTQLTDVEQEVNGLLDHNHNYKFDPKTIKAIMDSDRQYGFIFK